jgi:hypothetical protein
VAYLFLVRPLKAVIVAALLISGSAAADTAQWTRAKLYFRGWGAESFAAVPPQQLREMGAHFPRIVRVVTGDRLRELVTVLDLHAMRSDHGRCIQNTYLLVDVFDSAGTRHSYRADGRYLCSADNSASRPIDESFRKYFEKLFPLLPNQALEPTADRCAARTKERIMKVEMKTDRAIACRGLSLSRWAS